MLRFAPSPTGDIHIGNLRVAIFNYILAKQEKKELLLRIDDTDQERNIENKADEIVELLTLFNITFDKRVAQSENIGFYRKIAMSMMSKGQAFACFCSQELLEEKKQKAKEKKRPYRYDGTCENLADEDVIDNEQPFSVRIKSADKSISFTDRLMGDITSKKNEIDSFLIMRANKFPTYNFACAVDDMIYNISTVVRGSDHISNTPKQLHILKTLAYDQPINYLHLPIILDESGKKMSKRNEYSSVQWLLSEGFLPSAIANYLLLLGNKTEKEIFTMEEAIEWFNVANLSKSSAKFDIDKLRFINKEHIRQLNDAVLAIKIDYQGTYIASIARIYLEEASTLKELKPKIDAIFAQKEKCEEFAEEFAKIKEYLNTKETIDYEDFDALKNDLSEKLELKGKHLMKPLRFLLTGAYNGPKLGELYPLLKHYAKEIIR